MDNVGSSSPNPNRPDAAPSDGTANPPVRPEAAPAATPAAVSRAPLNLGGGTGAPVAPAAPKAPVVRPAPPKPPAPVAAGGRITTCKTFFTKLHPGAILFLEGQINDWLKSNPAIVIKQTDVTVGEVLEKKAEPSLIIVIWY
jgi:hypothetical protein